MLSIDGVVAGYGGTTIVQGISLEVPAGECAVLVGPNGHGKTTLLRAISGLIKVREGSIAFDGEDITRERAEKIVERGLIHIPQGDLVFPDMTVAENLQLGAFTRSAAKRAKARIEEVYEIFPRLLERQGQRARTLSGGERRMLAIGRGLMGDARLIMIDEPSLGLAPAIVDTMYDSFAALHKEGLTILLAEQSVDLALEAAQHAYVLQVGRTVLEGPAKAMADNPDVQRIYLGME